jgi:putative DNA primase/helicase
VNNFSTNDPVQAILGRLHGVNQTGPHQWEARCPAHDDNHASLSIGRGDDGRALLNCQAGCDTPSVVAAIGWTMADLCRRKAMPAPPIPKPLPPKLPRSISPPPVLKPPMGRIVATYDYRDSAETLLFQVCRYDPKGFRQRRPDGNGGWTWKLGDVSRVLYRLPELLTADKNAWVFVVEGEKDTDNLAVLGLVATTNSGGAGKWSKLADDSALYGRRVAIIPDKDAPDKNGKITGIEHGQDVAARLHGKAAVVKVIDLPDMPLKNDGRPRKDVSDWIELLVGKTAEELAAALVSMAEVAPPWTPKADAKTIAHMGGPVLVNLADVKPREVSWLWPSRVAIGKLTLLAGDPGLGKSFLTLDMAARISRGDGWPDFPASTAAPGGVVLLSAEDDLEDTITPRLLAAGADVSRIIALVAVTRFVIGGERQHPFSLTEDLAALEQAIMKTPDCRLVIIDPITAYLGATDSYKNAEIRGLLAPLSEIASRYGVAVVAVTHLRKGEGPAMYRAMGSLAFIATARAAFAVTKDPQDTTGERRFVLPIKHNLGNDKMGLAYRLLAPSGGVPAVSWESAPVTMSADEALSNNDSSSADDTGTERDEAAAWLRSILAQGPMKVQEIMRESKSAGFSWPTIKRAKKHAGIEPYHEGFATPWCWRLRVHCGSETT